MSQQLLVSVLALFVCVSYVLGSRMTGGWAPVSSNDSTIQEMAQFAMTTIEASSNSLYQTKIVSIANAEKQVVAGMNYRMDITYAPTDCRKGSTANLSDCAVNTNAQQTTCKVVVWSQPWQNMTQLTKHECN